MKTTKSESKSNSGRGGRRPGAGRPKKLTVEYQQHVRELIINGGSQEQLQAIIAKVHELATQGERWAVEWVMAWHAGKVPDELKLSNGSDGPFQIIVSKDVLDAV